MEGRNMLQEIFQREAAGMIRFLQFRRGHSMEEAEDLVQEGFVALHAYIQSKKLEAVHGGLAWKFVLGKSRDHRKKKKLPVQSAQSDQLYSAASHTEASDGDSLEELHAAIQRALESLKPPADAILEMRIFEQLNAETIAAAVDLSVRQVNRHLEKARQVVAREMERAGLNTEGWT
jgi:RNA polymerase sigma factor (sigma-70 family)